jgi:hypothetical protein
MVRDEHDMVLHKRAKGSGVWTTIALCAAIGAIGAVETLGLAILFCGVCAAMAAVDKVLGGQTVFKPDAGRPLTRRYFSWRGQRHEEFRTSAQKRNQNNVYRCQPARWTSSPWVTSTSRARTSRRPAVSSTGPPTSRKEKAIAPGRGRNGAPAPGTDTRCATSGTTVRRQHGRRTSLFRQ